MVDEAVEAALASQASLTPVEPVAEPKKEKK